MIPSARVLVLLLAACTPAAGTVGAWSEDSTGATSPSSAGTTSSEGSASTSTHDPSTSSSSATSTTSSSSGSESESTSTGASAAPPWVATVTQDGPPQLRVLDLEGGTSLDVCALAGVDVPDTLVFLPDGRLVGARADTIALWIADPCDCAITTVPPLEPSLSLHAIAELDDPEPGIVGVDRVRAALFGVHVDLAEVFGLGELVAADAITALAAAAAGDELHALAIGDGVRLLRIAPASGTITGDLPLAIPDHATGLTLAPGGEALLACDQDGALWRIDPADASATMLEVGLADPCRTLAAPHGTIACIDALF